MKPFQTITSRSEAFYWSSSLSLSYSLTLSLSVCIICPHNVFLLSLRLSVCLCVCLFVCLSVFMSSSMFNLSLSMPVSINYSMYDRYAHGVHGYALSCIVRINQLWINLKTLLFSRARVWSASE